MIATIHEVTNQDYSWFFDQWYYGSGYPILQYSWKQLDNMLIINVNQLHVPMNKKYFILHPDLLLQYSDSTEIKRITLDADNQTISFPVSKTIKSIILDPAKIYLIKQSEIKRR